MQKEIDIPDWGSWVTNEPIQPFWPTLAQFSEIGFTCYLVIQTSAEQVCDYSLDRQTLELVKTLARLEDIHEGNPIFGD